MIKTTILTFFIFIIFTANSFSANLKKPEGSLTFPSNHQISVILAKTEKEKRIGLSGVKKNQFSKNTGMLFVYKSKGGRYFWMPDTYFDLDIIFLSKKLKVVAISRGLKAHPGRDQTTKIDSTGMITAVHVLEVRTDSFLTKNLKINDKLIWSGPAFAD